MLLTPVGRFTSTTSPIIYWRHSRVCSTMSPVFQDVSCSTAFAQLIRVNPLSYLIMLSMSTWKAMWTLFTKKICSLLNQFLTTLLMKHFPTFKTKFIPNAVAQTVTPESFCVLFSQCHHWINSTVQTLCEFILLPEHFGFCCFSMQFLGFIDLLSTLVS